MFHDLRLAVRTLRKSPAYTVVAVLALALGIGANVAIFSAVYVVLLAPLPYPEPDRVVIPVSTNTERAIEFASVSYADFEDYRAQRDIFTDVAVYTEFGADVTGDGVPERADASSVSSRYFAALGAHPLLGRTFIESDHAPGAPEVVVISEGLWERRFGRDPAATSRDLRVAGRPVHVVGVMPEDAAHPADVDVWLPFRAATLEDDQRTRRDNFIFGCVARLQPGVTAAQASARLVSIALRVAREFPASRAQWSARVVPMREFIVERDLRRTLIVLAAAVGAVLVIVCVNVANLLLARGTSRKREMAVRLALGASRARLVRQLMIENATLGILGGTFGVMQAYWMVGGLVMVAPAGVPFASQIGVNTPALAAAVCATLVSILGFGVLPALTSSRTRPVDAIKAGAEARATGRLRDTLVVAQIAIAVLLVAVAALLTRSFVRLLAVAPGADVERVISGRVTLPRARYPEDEDRMRFYATLTERLERHAGVAGAAATSLLPVGGPGFALGRVFLAEGHPAPPAGRDVDAIWSVVTPSYFKTVGIRIVRGRDFDPRDTADSTPVIAVSQTFATAVFGSDDPIGRRVRSWRDENLLREIVAVVADVKLGGLADQPEPLVYVPHAQQGWSSMVVVVRAAADPRALAAVLRTEVERLDPELAVARLATMSEFARASIARERFGSTLLAAFSTLAVVLAAIGIYGVMAYSVTGRTRELGVRTAIGATPRQLAAIVMRRGLALTIGGTALGMGAAAAAAQTIEGLLFGITATDAVTFAGTPILLAVVALAACYVPARRASRIDPSVALRSE